MKVPFFRPDISDLEISEVIDSLKSGWLTTGPKVKLFQENFSKFVGSKYAVALNSCTAALHLALDAIGLKAGELVIVPTMTFAATAEVIRYFDAVPVFVDCDDELCIDPEELRSTVAALSQQQSVAGLSPPFGKVTAIIPVHYGGNVCHMDKIMNIAAEFNLSVIEDCAHTIPSYWRARESDDWKHAGSIGDIGCFSFYANKCITTGEGGMAVTDDEDLAQRMRLMSLHGMSRDPWKRFTSEGSWQYEIVAPGFKYNMTDLAGSLGFRQLERAEEMRKARERIALRYNETFGRISALKIPIFDVVNRIHSWHIYHLRLNTDTPRLNRDQFIADLKEKGVLCSVHYMPLHLQPYYSNLYGLTEGLFPNSEAIWKELISLPIFPAMTDEEIGYVIATIEREGQ